MAVAIPGYVGYVELAKLGTTEADFSHSQYVLVVPCLKINWTASCNVNSVTSAAGGPFPNCFPGFNNVGSFEFWGPWRDDFNPFHTTVPRDATPLLIGHAVAARFSVWKNNVNAYVPSAFISISEWTTRVDGAPVWHLAATSAWQYDGTDVATLIRTAGGDNQ